MRFEKHQYWIEQQWTMLRSCYSPSRRMRRGFLLRKNRLLYSLFEKVQQSTTGRRTLCFFKKRDRWPLALFILFTRIYLLQHELAAPINRCKTDYKILFNFAQVKRTLRTSAGEQKIAIMAGWYGTQVQFVLRRLKKSLRLRGDKPKHRNLLKTLGLQIQLFESIQTLHHQNQAVLLCRWIFQW